MHVGGYAYPWIEPAVLEQALPALTELLILSYGFNFEGDLIPPIQDEVWMVETARRYGVQSVMVLTPFSGGAFNGQLVKAVTENRVIQDKIIIQVTDMVEKQGYAGVNINFEYIPPGNRGQYAEFAGHMRRKLNERGCRVSASAAAKNSERQKGLLVEGIDYRMLGENTDYVFLMTYDWGYTYSPPMAVAPLDKVRQVIEYAVTAIPPEKIILGIPNYGYDWTLPYEKGITRARTIGNPEAAALAAQNGAAVQYAERSQAPWFTYGKNGMEHAVWFEDSRSITAKWDLIREYSLAGGWYWDLMRPFQGNLFPRPSI